MWGTKLYCKHKWVIGGVVEEGMRKGEVLGSNPNDHIACDFTRKKMRDLRLPCIKIFFFPIFKNQLPACEKIYFHRPPITGGSPNRL